MSDEPRDRRPPVDKILTPGGQRLSEDVHSVGEEYFVRGGPRRRLRVARKKEISQAEAQALKARGLQISPGGFRAPNSIHEIRSGERIDQSVDLTAFSAEELAAQAEGRMAAPPPAAISESGWIANAFWENTTGTPIVEFRTNWLVPPPPNTPSQQTIFLFNGLQDRTGTRILQPVLQWGLAAAMGGGEFWTIASWYVEGSGQAFHTPLVRVDVGEVLKGAMHLFAEDSGGFSYRCEFEGRQGTALEVAGVPELAWCYQALEAYSIDDCNDYPDTDRTEFDSITVRTRNPLSVIGWGIEVEVAGCGRRVEVVDDSATQGKVNIWYR